MKKKIDIVDIIISVFVGAIVLIMCLGLLLHIEYSCGKPIETTYEICEITSAEHTKAVEHRRGIPGKTAGRTIQSEEFNIYVEFADGNVHYFTVDQDTYAKAKANSKMKVEKIVTETPVLKDIVVKYEIVDFLK